MSKKKATNNSYRKDIVNNPVAVLIMGLLAIPAGIFFIVSQSGNKPIMREEAVSYAGAFDYYDTSSKNYREIYFEDGFVCDVYPHTETGEFREKMNSLKKGEKLYILINPNNDYVAEIKTETEELLNFETSQQAIDSYDNGYIAIGIVACVCGVFLIVYAIGSANYARKETARHSTKKAAGNRAVLLRHADTAVKGRTLLEATVESYQICYRRVKCVNELVVNGMVYDEKAGVIEFEHTLNTNINGHTIEAGYDSEGYSYILFDGEIIKRKRRWI